MILLDAIYVNNSGGKVLLDYLLQRCHQSVHDFFYLLDQRVAGSYLFLPKENTKYLKPSLSRRHRFYQKEGHRFSSILCFGNIPPSLRIQACTYTYFHNILFLDSAGAFTLMETLSLKLKGQIIKYLSRNTSKWWVQSYEVKKMIVKKWGVEEGSIQVMPFFQRFQDPFPLAKRKPKTFLYVSDGNPYKQHTLLLEAFKKVFLETPEVQLRLTVSDRYPAVLEAIQKYQQQGIPVQNLGWVSREQLTRQYQENQFLIYPSARESFGLGLIEAAQAAMPIIAVDLPYVHAVIEPFQTFAPNDITAIYQAMKSALEGTPAASTLKIKDKIEQMLTTLDQCAG